MPQFFQRFIKLLFNFWSYSNLLLLLYMSSCANEAPPSGGKKDISPPKIKYSDPPNKTLNFKNRQINIGFDEYLVQTLDPKEILISPPMEKKPRILVNGKTLTINLTSQLKDSTTYTINFGDAIRDNNEGVILKNFTYVFSTGNNLDSASLSGIVQNIDAPKNTENVIVSLYPVDSIDGILHSKPFYFAKTDKSGSFKINNIHAGIYHLYELKDENLNYIYDQANELIGFQDSLITLRDSSALRISANIFESKNVRPKLIDALAISPGRALITYNAPVRTIKFNSTTLAPSDILEINSKNDSLTYWFSSIYEQKSVFDMVVNDTIRDTMRLDLKYLSKDTVGDKKLYPLRIESQAVKEDSLKKMIAIRPVLSPFKPIILTLSRPVIDIDSNKHVYILNDSTHKKDSVSYTIAADKKRLLTIDYPQLEKIPYTLVIPDSTFRDQWGWWNSKLIYQWNSDAFENYGNILMSLKFEHPEKHYVFKILDQQDMPVATFYYVGNEEKKIIIKNVAAGAYHLQAIDDVNKNGEWDSGDFAKKKQPEKIINFKEIYTLKGSWDLEIEVTL